MKHDQIIRRATTTSRTSRNNNHDALNLPYHTDGGYTDSYSHLSRNQPRPGRRRRRRTKSGPNSRLDQLFLQNIHLRLVRYLRRNPDNLYIVVFIVFGIVFLICIVFSNILQRRQQRKFFQPIDHNNASVHGSHLDPVEMNKQQDIVNLDDKPKKVDKRTKNQSANERKISKSFPKQDHDGQNHGQNNKEGKETMKRSSSTTISSSEKQFRIIFPEPSQTIFLRSSLSKDIILRPPIMDDEVIEEGDYMDFEGLEFETLQEEGLEREIIEDDRISLTEFRDPSAARDDDYESYYAFDDDIIRNDFVVKYYEEEDKGILCRRISEHRVNFQNCNTFHEMPPMKYHGQYVGAGAYRQVLVLNHTFSKEQEKIIMKDIGYFLDIDLSNFEFTRMDAMVAERLTASPRIYDIYGMCGIGILSEFFPHGDLEKMAIIGNGLPDPKRRKKDPLISYNDLTGIEKLTISLQMAEALADLHGYSGGAIVHQDVQLSQFLLNENKTLVKLNDFNRAEFMLWDVDNQEYCKYLEGVGRGDWRSPEEYYDELLDEKVDVYSLGNNMYSLLTGLWVFYDSNNAKRTVKRVKKGEKPYIDPRYKEGKDVAEANLAEIIEPCFAFDPEKRPSIFDLVSRLREAVKEVEESDKRLLEN